ncbi:hypothetical protein KKG15_02675 [Patescibacteria group bacterium]|nr:hypothetical protein [Patescibacteria group bacterium]
MRRKKRTEGDSKEFIIDWIKRLHQRGEYLNNRYIKRKYPKRHGRACYLFRNWTKTVEAAGLDYNKDIRNDTDWDRDKIIKEIERRRKKGRSLNPGLNKDLLVPAIRCIGSYEEAIQAAGFSYEKLGIRSKRLSKEKVKEQLFQLSQKGEPLHAGYLSKHYPSLLENAVYRFGSHKKAIEAMGLQYSMIRRQGDVIGWIQSLTVEDMQKIEERIFSITRKEDKNG